MVCLQLGLPNNLSAPARLSNKSLGAGGEGKRWSWLTGGIYCSSAHGEARENCLRSEKVQCLDTDHCFSPIPVEVAPPVLSPVVATPGRQLSRQDSS